MDQYIARVERSRDGSIAVVLYRNFGPVRIEAVSSVRHGRRRAYDLLCSAVDRET